MSVMTGPTPAAPVDGAAAEPRRILSRDAVIGAASLFACLLVWQALANSGVVSRLVLPGPADLVERAVYLAGATGDPPFQLERDIGFTLMRLLSGFALAASLAVPVGIASALSRPMARLLAPILAVFMAIPALAFVPILMLLTGIGEATDFTVVVIAAFIPIAVYVHEGVRLIDTKYFWTASSFGASRRAVFRQVILPAAVVPLVSGFRMGMGYAWRSLIATESLTALTGGLGYTIFQSSQFFDTQTVYLYMFVIAVLGFAFEAGFRAIESRTAVRWGVLASRRR
jgi:NitT/TauT family transport system permease protein